MRVSRRGITLAEVLVGLVITAVMIAGIVALEMARSSISDQARDDAGIKYPSRAEAHLAALNLTKRIETADRYVVNGTSLQLRHPQMTGACAVGVPAPACFDDPNNYQWSEYQGGAGGTFLFYRNTGAGCANVQTLVGSDVAVNFVSNGDMVAFTLTWTNPGNGEVMVFPGEVSLLNRSVNGGLGLQAPSLVVSNPPAGC